jgi:hypothetical protein
MWHFNSHEKLYRSKIMSFLFFLKENHFCIGIQKTVINKPVLIKIYRYQKCWNLKNKTEPFELYFVESLLIQDFFGWDLCGTKTAGKSTLLWNIYTILSDFTNYCKNTTFYLTNDFLFRSWSCTNFFTNCMHKYIETIIISEMNN